MDACFGCKKFLLGNSSKFPILERDYEVQKCLVYKIFQITQTDFVFHENEKKFLCSDCRLLLVQIHLLEQKFAEIFTPQSIKQEIFENDLNIENEEHFEDEPKSEFTEENCSKEKGAESKDKTIDPFEDHRIKTETILDFLNIENEIGKSNDQSIDFNLEEDATEDKENENEKILRKQFLCSECQTFFTSKAHLERHRKITHQEEKPFKCMICGKSYLTSTELTSHQRKIHEGLNPYQCSQCSEIFLKKITLETHERKHDLRKYKCENCGKCSKTASDLYKHEQTHSTYRPHQCQECSKSFLKIENLKSHKRIHSGEKPYRCKQCPKAFAQGNALQRHENIHSREKYYHCKQCAIYFSQKDSLQRHNRNKHNSSQNGEKPLKCEEFAMNLTPKVCIDRQNLNIHNSSGNEDYSEENADEKPFQCMDCPESFSQRSHLRKHAITHFNGEESMSENPLTVETHS